MYAIRAQYLRIWFHTAKNLCDLKMDLYSLLEWLGDPSGLWEGIPHTTKAIGQPNLFLGVSWWLLHAIASTHVDCFITSTTNELLTFRFWGMGFDEAYETNDDRLNNMYAFHRKPFDNIKLVTFNFDDNHSFLELLSLLVLLATWLISSFVDWLEFDISSLQVPCTNIKRKSNENIFLCINTHEFINKRSSIAMIIS